MEQPTEDNVIHFPKLRFDSPPQSLEEMKDKIEEYRMGFSWEMSEILLNNVLSELSRVGLPHDYFDREDSKPHIYLLFEAIRSLYLHSCNIDYDLHEFAEEYYKDLDNVEEDMKEIMSELTSDDE